MSNKLAHQRHKDADFNGTDFNQVDLSGAEFINCQFLGTSFRSATLVGATFERCSFFDPEAGSGVDFTFANLTEARFERSDLTTANLARTRCYDLVLDNCPLQGVELANADFRLNIGKTSDLAAFTMHGCNFAYGDLSNTYLKGCALTDNRMIEALLHNACLEEVDFTGTDLSNIQGKGMSLVGADLRGAMFNNLNPREIDLTGVRITLDQALWLLDPIGVVIEP